MDERRRRRSESSNPPPYSFSQPAPMHICSLCGKPRSSRFQKRHPIESGQTPEPSICSRPSCAKAVAEMLLAKTPSYPGVVVYEIHHHHYHNHISSGAEAPSPISSVAELPGESSLAGRTELPGDSTYVPYGPGCLSLIRDESPPPVNRSNKPTLRRWFR
jgi:hypothetical protein